VRSISPTVREGGLKTMKLRNLKFIGILILLAYLGIGVFGLFPFSHASQMHTTNCPYALGSSSVCQNNIEHIDHWLKFSNTTFKSQFVFSFLILGIILYLFNAGSFLDPKRYFYVRKRDTTYTSLEKIIKWLSLFENSPPVNTAILLPVFNKLN